MAWDVIEEHPPKQIVLILLRYEGIRTLGVPYFNISGRAKNIKLLSQPIKSVMVAEDWFGNTGLVLRINCF